MHAVWNSLLGQRLCVSTINNSIESTNKGLPPLGDLRKILLTSPYVAGFSRAEKDGGD
jgi:hypothetical protein